MFSFVIKSFLLLLCAVNVSWGITLDVVNIFQPLSLHGTDAAEEGQNQDVVQAAIFSRPMALSGAFPEVLAQSVGRPFRMEGSPTYQVKECNLFTLCNIGINAAMVEEVLIVTIDVEKMEIHKDVRLTARAILNLCVKAVQKTLWAYPMADGESIKCKIVIVGTTENNQGLLSAGKEFTLGNE